MPFRDEYSLEPVDTEPEPDVLPGAGREPDLDDLYHAGADMEPGTIRSLVEEQAETWRSVPALVLEVQGRTGYVDSYPAAYISGYWQVSPEGYAWSKDNLPRVYVDCASGELVSTPVVKTPPVPMDEVQEAVLDDLEAHGDVRAKDAVVADLGPRYGEEAVEAAIQDMYDRGLHFTVDWDLAVNRPEVSPAPDHLVERMAAEHPGRLDAEETVAMLEERAAEPHSDIYDVEEREAWREQVREQLGLGPVYTRD